MGLPDAHYASVTNTIIAALETGTAPWVHPWSAGAGDMVPRNLSSGRRYRGINVLLLSLKTMQCGYAANRWMTYQQARALGANVRKGATGTEVVLFKMLDIAAPNSLVWRAVYLRTKCLQRLDRLATSF